MDCDVPKLVVKQATPCVDDDSAAKWRLIALSRMDLHVLKQMAKKIAPFLDEDFAAEFRLDAQVLQERDHA